MIEFPASRTEATVLRRFDEITVPKSSSTNKNVIAELPDQLDQAQATILQLKQLPRTHAGDVVQVARIASTANPS